MSDQSNVAAVVGDPAFFRIAEANVLAELGRKGLQLDSMQRHDWVRAAKDTRPEAALIPPLMPGRGKVVIWRNPAIGILQKAADQCGLYDNLFLVLLFDGDTYDKRSKVLRELDKEGQLHCLGLIRPNDTRRYISAMRMIATSEELNLDDMAIKVLGQLGHVVRRQVSLGGERKSERLVHDLSRIRQEAIKAQLYAGWGKTVSAEHVRAMCSKAHVSEVWDLIDAMFAGNVTATIRALDGCVSNVGDARKMLGLLKAQLELLAKVRGIVEQGSDREPKDVATKVRSVPTGDNYEMWDSTSDKTTLSPLDEYRAKKLLELRHTPIWVNCHGAINVCLNTHADLVGSLGPSWQMVIFRMCLDICSLAAR